MADAANTVSAAGVDDTPPASNERRMEGWEHRAFYALAVGFTVLHLLSLGAGIWTQPVDWLLEQMGVDPTQVFYNRAGLFPLEPWQFRMIHILGAVILGFGTIAAWSLPSAVSDRQHRRAAHATLVLGGLPALYALGSVIVMGIHLHGGEPVRPADFPSPMWEEWHFGVPLTLGATVGVVGAWLFRGHGHRVQAADWVLIVAAVASSGYLLVHLDGTTLRMRAGTPFATIGNMYAAGVGIMLILELTRRVAGLALVVIASVFIVYAVVGPHLPGFLAHQGFTTQRLLTYLYTDSGILGPTTTVSSTVIFLFITFAAFLQVSRVGEYFVNFAFAVAGRARGGPAKVAVFASGLMGTINGTSAGNVVATGSLTIPLMKQVGYTPSRAGAIEAAASTGGQIMPPIMGAGAFIMAEITGIPYSEIVIAAIIPALLYFASILFMVDLEAQRQGMRGMRADELPALAGILRQAFLFAPIIILIGALYIGYTPIRAGIFATVAAFAVSWLSPHRMDLRALLRALQMSATMSVQIIAVCACAGVIVGVIALTGVGGRFSSLLLGLAANSQIIALVFAMIIAAILGMGMPTTAAYAVAASVVAPGLISMGIEPLVAHFFVFYYAVVSAITPPVALASYAAAAISGANPMRTSVDSFMIGLAAFIVPFMFFYSPGLLMEGSVSTIIQVVVTACIGIYLLASAVQGWLMGPAPLWLRPILLVAAVLMIKGGWQTDLAGIGLGVLAAGAQVMRGRRGGPGTGTRLRADVVAP